MLIKWAVFDGPWWSGNGEVHLYWGNRDGDPVRNIEWPETWPETVDRDFLKARGFIVCTA